MRRAVFVAVLGAVFAHTPQAAFAQAPQAALSQAPQAALAQAPQKEIRVTGGPYLLPPPRFSATSDLVEVDVVVRDRDGRPVAGLAQQNFTLTDNGRTRELSAFSVSTAPAPPAAAAHAPGEARPAAMPARAAGTRAIELFFDDVNTDKNDLANARNAALRFAREALTPADRVAVYTASTDGELGFTLDRGKLAAAIAALAPHPRQSKYGEGGACPRMTLYEAYLIANHLDPAALNAAMAEKIECNRRIGIVDDGTSAYTGGNVGGGIAGSDNNSEQVVAQANGEWDQARGVSEATQGALLAGIGDLARQPGNRLLVLASDGFLSEGPALEQQQEHIVSAALHAGIVIDALDAKGVYTTGPGRPLAEQDDMGPLPLAVYVFNETRKLPEQQELRQALANFTQSTGGLFFKDNNDLTLGFERLGMMPEVTYHLAFSAGDVPQDGKFHKLAVALTPRSPDAVQARAGYFAPLPEASVAGLHDQMDDAMRSTEALAGVAATADSVPGGGHDTVTVHLDMTQVPLVRRRGGYRVQDLYFLAGLFDARGRFVAGKQGEMDLRVSDATVKRLQREGLRASLSLDAPAGSYRLRVVVGEFSDGKIFASSQAVQIQ